MSLDKLRELVAAAAKASLGPWEVDRDNIHAGNIATLHGDELGYAEVWTPSWIQDGKRMQHSNAAFIALARNAIPDLESLLSRHEALKAAMREKAKEWRAKDTPGNDPWDAGYDCAYHELADELEALAEDSK